MVITLQSGFFNGQRQGVSKALSLIKNGQTVYIASGAGEPRALVDGLLEHSARFFDLEILQLPTPDNAFPLDDVRFRNHFKYTPLCGSSDTKINYIPMEMSELPHAIRSGFIQVDVALVQVSPPNRHGLCSLGGTVDATRAVIESASIVVAQVNKFVPVTFGDTQVPIQSLHVLVEKDTPLYSVAPLNLDTVSLTIGQNISTLIDDGTTLYVDRTPICASTTRHLERKRHLGIHTYSFTDDLMLLQESGAVTNRMKKSHRGKSVASVALGSEALYEYLDDNPYVEFLPLDEFTDPIMIGREERFVPILEADEVDLNGTARLNGLGRAQGANLSVARDMLSSSRHAASCFSILGVRATTPGGQSAIVPFTGGSGETVSSTGVDFVVTEYGTAQLRGLTRQERAMAMISVAHPRFQKDLLQKAQDAGYLSATFQIPREVGHGYPAHYENRQTFHDKSGKPFDVFFRPVKPSDAPHFQRLFYSLSSEAVRNRYHGSKKTLTAEEAQQMCMVDYSRDMAMVGLVGDRTNPKMIAECSCLYLSNSNMGEFDIVVHADYQGLGIGKYLANYMKKIAYTSGLSGLIAIVVQRNSAIIELLKRAWPTAFPHYADGSHTITLRFPSNDVNKPKDSIIVYSGKFGDFRYGPGHPFLPGRAKTMMQWVEQLGYLDEPWIRVVEPGELTFDLLIGSCTPEYLDALRAANDGVWQDKYAEFGLGTPECPVFKGMFDYIQLYTAATVTGARLIIDEQANVVFNPLGGFHHAGPNNAEGFCFVNDILVAINMFVNAGMRVAVVDIDAHHGNGVQDAWYQDDRVLTISIHQTGETIYPWSGFKEEVGERNGLGYNLNVPLPEQADDECLETVFNELVDDAVKRFAPTVVVAIIGGDGHRADPLANLSYTNNGYVAAMSHIRDYAHHLLLLGSGGYSEDASARAWTRMWANANRIDELPDYLLTMGGTFMGSAGMGGAEIVDMPYRISGEQKDQMLSNIRETVAFHRERTLPRILPH